MALIAVVALFRLLVGGEDGGARAVEMTVCRAAAGGIRVTLPLYGVIEAREKAEISSNAQGIVEYLRPEGDFVKKGETVARLETYELKTQLDEALQQKRQIEIDQIIAADEQELKIIEKRNRTIYEGINLSKDEIHYRQMKYGLDYTRKIELDYSRENSDIDISNQELELSEKQVLRKNGFVSEDEINDIKYQLYSKAKAREVTVLNLEKVMRGTDPGQLAEKISDIRSDSISVEVASSAYEIMLSTRAKLKRGLQNKLDTVLKEIAKARTMIDECELRAPIDGIVIHGKMWITEGQREKIKAGMNVFAGWSFMSVSSLDDMNILFKVNEVDISRIKKGMKVDFRLASNPGEVHRAEIIEIGNVVSYSEGDANGISNVAVKARIAGDAGKMGLKPGMAVSAEIVIAEKGGAVTVPSNAISRDATVTMRGGGLRKVKAGLRNFFAAEIVEGLAEGEEILVPARSASLSVFKGAPVETYLVKKDSISDVVSEIGELVPANKTNVAVNFSGKVNKIVEEGLLVEKGYEVAVIDVKETADKLMEKELRAKVLEKDRKLIEEKARSEIVALENSLKVKEMDKYTAQLDYEILIAPMTPEKRKDFEYSIRLCENALKGVDNELKSKSEMSKKGYISQSEINKIKIRLNKARADLAVAEYKFEYDLSLPLPNNVIKAKIENEKARLDYELTSMKLEKRRRKLKFDVEKNGIETTFNQNRIDEYAKIVGNAKVRAPISGTTIYVSKFTNEGLKKIKEGDVTRKNMTFLEIANLDRFLVSGSIPEEQFRKIYQGQAAEFFLPAEPDRRYPGKIRKLGLFAKEKESGMFSFSDLMGDSGGETPKFFDVEIESDARNPRFQPGMSVGFEIALESKKDVLKVPRRFLFRDDGGYFVYSQGGAKMPVTVGLKNKTDVEIVSGLREGETIAY